MRSCPVKAIKVEKTYTDIIQERCIGCGNCLSNCPQHAKVLADSVSVMEQYIASGETIVAVLGCSFPSYFHYATPGQLVAGIKKAGFAEVHEGASGVELIGKEYARALEESDVPLISSHCPAVIDLIERHYPQLLKNLVGSVNHMVATGRMVKGVLGDHVRVVYITSCVAAKFQVEDEKACGAVDLVLTYRELESIFSSRSIDITKLEPEPFDGREPHLGRLFSLSQGSFRAFSLEIDPLDTEIMTAEGEVNVMGIVKDLAAGRISPKLIDLRYCYDGCIGGPGKNNDITEFSRRNQVISHYKTPVEYCTSECYRGDLSHISFARSFTDRHAKLPIPKGSDVKKILQATNKFTRKDELDCRACGYRTCREYAVAVFQGLADLEMCLPHNLQQLEEERGRLIQKYELAKRELDQGNQDEFIVGSDPKTLEALDQIKQVGPTPTTVLVRGESGTGKELAARAIHRMSKRSDKLLVTVNCTAITDSLLESELFGHKKGAFTGAIADKKGLFEAADGGTIFLDEIGDITPKLQGELLRVLDIGEVRPVGGTASKRVDVRLIAATNKCLEDGVRDGWFREDLYYRLNVFSITMPPLRERTQSIPELAHYFLDKSRKKLGKNIVGIEERAINAMMRYPWPGNIREMQNIIERAAVLTNDELIKLGNLPLAFAESYAEEGDDVIDLRSFKKEREPHVLRVEKKLIQRYLNDAGGNVSKAAQLANIPRRTFYRILDKHGLKGRSMRARDQGED